MTEDPTESPDPRQAGNKAQNALDESPTAEDVVRRLDQFWADSPKQDLGDVRSLAGFRIGNYVIQRMIGLGSHGMVYKARDEQLQRDAAIKIPRPEVLVDSDRRMRFEVEAQTAARLDHPSIVQVFEAQLDGPTPYIAAAYCAGPSLADWIIDHSERQSCQTAATFILELAEAVDYAHRRGVVHRDIKPSNVLLVPVDSLDSALSSLDRLTPKLTDFGLALLAEGCLEDTRSSVMIGTPLYMAPEQAGSQRETIGARTDIFSMGAMLYELLTGSPPFNADTYIAVLARLREENAVPITELRSDVDRDLATICMKCLQRNPDDRYGSAAELAEDLSRYLRGDPIHARPLTAAQRLARWSEHRSRTGEATTTIILLSIFRFFYGFFGIFLIAFLDDARPTVAERNNILWFLFTVATPTELWIIWAARQNLRRKLPLWSYRLTLLMILVWCLVAIVIAFGSPITPLWYQRMPGARITVYTFMSGLFMLQAIAWWLVDWRRLETNKLAAWRRWGIVGFLSTAVLTSGFAAMLRGSWRDDRESLPGPTHSMVFDGEDDLLSVRSFGFTTGQPFTLEAWVRPADSRKSFVAVYGPLTLGLAATPGGNRFQVTVQGSATQILTLNAQDEIALGRWSHLAVTYDGAVIKLYIDGQPQSITSGVYDETVDDHRLIGGAPNPLRITDVWPGRNFTIGSNQLPSEGDAFPFAGRIGEVRLSSTVFYRETFSPQSDFSVSTDTQILFRLSPTDESEIQDQTGSVVGHMHR